MKIHDQDYLRAEQYKTSANLQARIDLHRRFNTNPYDWMLWVFDQLQIQEGQRILEVGCGPGSLWTANRSRLPAGVRLVLADLSGGMVAQARRQLTGPDHSPGAPVFTYAVADAQRLPFPDQAFNLVIANHMLYHVPAIPMALQELRRVMKPGARFFAATNGRQHMVDLYDLVEDYAPQVARLRNSIRRFSLENGPEQLQDFFAGVHTQPYAADLDVTAVEPLLAYLNSSWSFAEALSPEQQQELEAHIRTRFAQHNRLYIRKSQGLIAAHKLDNAS